jgi:outer membrane biosynthesis protein TonB
MRSGSAQAGLPSSGVVLGTGIALRHGRPDRRAVTTSLVFHAVVVTGLVAAGALQSRNAPEFETYRVRLYSPPAQVEGPPPAQPRVTQAIVAAPRPEPVTERPRSAVAEVKRPEGAPVATAQPKSREPVAGPNPRPNSAGGENLDVDIAGQEFPFPVYLENIIRQINRYFRWSGDSSPEAVVAFYIQRDGATGGMQIVESSGDYRFNLQAMGAIELAGRRGAFGPLPDGWVQDRLWVKFRFIPPGT